MSIFNFLPTLNRPAALSREGGDTAPSTVRPVYRIREQADNYAVTVYLPGVAKEDLEITAENGAITIGGGRTWKRPVEWTPLYRETSDARFELTLTHDNSIDVDNVKAELSDGVLHLTLAKSEAIKPRKIAIN